MLQLCFTELVQYSSWLPLTQSDSVGFLVFCMLCAQLLFGISVKLNEFEADKYFQNGFVFSPFDMLKFSFFFDIFVYKLPVFHKSSQVICFNEMYCRIMHEFSTEFHTAVPTSVFIVYAFIYRIEAAAVHLNREQARKTTEMVG